MISRRFLVVSNWFKRNRPSGVVTAFMTFFIVSYVIIVKLDSSDRMLAIQKDEQTTRLSPPIDRPYFAKVQRTREAIVPSKIMEEFARDHEKSKHIKQGSLKSVNYDYYDDVKNTTDDMQHHSHHTTGVYIQSDNERIISEHLEENEQVIDDNWNSYLDSNKNKQEKSVKQDKKSSLVLLNNRLQFQEVIGERPGQIVDLTGKLPKYVKVYDPFKESVKHRNSINSNKCILLKTLHGSSPICIHDTVNDEIISAEIQKSGTWEPNYLYAVGSVLKLNNDMVFLDLGCNIGVYTILAAQLGHAVIGLDPNKANLRLLTKSLSLGGIKKKVTLLWNAISDVRENVTLSDIIGNIGASFVEPGSKPNLDSDHKAYSITLDDLIVLLKGKQVFIKMDIETFELRALKGGKNFFKEVDVQYILMEWLYHRQFDTGKEIIEIMTKHGLYPHVNAHHNTKLEPENYRSWPGNVLWIKY